MNTEIPLRDTIRVAMNDALAQVVNAEAPQLPELYWTCRKGEDWSEVGVYGLVSWYSTEPVADIALRWAVTLGLTEVVPGRPTGTFEYTGQIHGQPVCVWAITDRDTFKGRGLAAEAHTDTMLAEGR